MTRGWGKKSGDVLALKQDDLVFAKIMVNIKLVAK